MPGLVMGLVGLDHARSFLVAPILPTNHSHPNRPTHLSTSCQGLASRPSM